MNLEHVLPKLIGILDGYVVYTAYQEVIDNGRECFLALGFGGNGDLRAVATVDKQTGQLQGKAEAYYSNEVSVRKSVSFRNGNPHGPMVYFLQDGTIHKIYHYKDGEAIEEVVQKNAHVSARYQLRGGVRDGRFTEYYRTGNKHLEGFLKDGAIYGKQTYYHHNGNKKLIVRLGSSDGPIGSYKQGLRTEYHSDGTLYRRESYQKNERHGWCFYWPAPAKNKDYPLKKKYSRGKLISTRVYNKKEGKYAPSNAVEPKNVGDFLYTNSGKDAKINIIHDYLSTVTLREVYDD